MHYAFFALAMLYLFQLPFMYTYTRAIIYFLFIMNMSKTISINFSLKKYIKKNLDNYLDTC
jgi:hypothetical protein